MTCRSHHNVCYYVNYVHVQPLQIAQTDLLQGCDELTVWRVNCKPFDHLRSWSMSMSMCRFI